VGKGGLKIHKSVRKLFWSVIKGGNPSRRDLDGTVEGRKKVSRSKREKKGEAEFFGVRGGATRIRSEEWRRFMANRKRRTVKGGLEIAQEKESSEAASKTKDSLSR